MVPIYFHTSTYTIFLAGGLGGGLSFSNTPEFVTILKNKGVLTYGNMT